MYKVIMAPTEGSDSEKAAITVAVKLAHRFEADLRLVRVKLEPLVIDTIAQTPVIPTEEMLQEERIAHLRKLEALGSECRALGEIDALRPVGVHRAIVDKGVSIPANFVVGEDPVEDRRRFAVTEGGVVVVARGTRIE
jgi:nucleotide-binding universal stress UspA family protein